ncbi:MAG: hypothetical protein DHS20C19_03830 [Acidimicrobiales bacterium]|nr:MAG: hypothetical protein DHS20C19_03830 [Acidimicrobiales bacterium]
MDSDRFDARALEKVISEHGASSDPFALPHTVQLTSFGGSGTTALTDTFVEAGLDLPRGPGQWPHKHLRRPPAAEEVPEGFRVVYPVSDPRDAVLSLFRRSFQLGHWKAMHVTPAGLGDPPLSLCSLDDFLGAGVDEFGLADHLRGWFDHDGDYPVMFLRFDLIDDAWDELAEFVGLPDTIVPLRYETRHSDWTRTPPEIRGPLDAMYGDLAREIADFPAVQIR